jgi:N6-L-threonylcarbamoyladenine synthase
MADKFTCLAIESSCDETAAAVVVDGREVLSNVVLTQIDLHAVYGGVVPEIACRAHIQGIVPVVERALADAKVGPQDLRAIAVTHAPGLIGALLIGVSAAKALALVWKKPLVPVDHIHGHLYACKMAFPELAYPNVSLIVSGGHTSLYLCRGALEYELLGATRDDAAGEAFDKVAKILGLPFPGGPSIDRLARGRDPFRYSFRRTMAEEEHDDFSFSGIKTAVLYRARGQDARARDLLLGPEEVADVAASFQETMVDILLEKSFRACSRHGLKTLAVGGGVACNTRLREKGRQRAAAAGVEIFFPPPAWCTDNAAMIGGLAFHLFRAGRTAGLDLDAVPTKLYRK